jgi:hypothetical protein
MYHTLPKTCTIQVKSKSREVQLHKDSSLGEAVLECYASGNKNVFSLGFVPVAGDNTVVLLARDTPANSNAVRDLGVDMSQVGFRALGVRVAVCPGHSNMGQPFCCSHLPCHVVAAHCTGHCKAETPHSQNLGLLPLL